MSSNRIIPPTPSDEDYAREAKAQETFAAEGDQGEVFTSRDPFELFATWMTLARKHEVNDPNAMSLATVDRSGLPDVRILLLKELDEGFVFYSNTGSAKGEQIKENDLGAICFHWKSVRRQVRARGLIEPVAAKDADAYFASRSRTAQIGAWASQQSRPMDDEHILKTRVEDYESIYEGRPVPRPDWWRGFRLCPYRIEFWVNRPHRLHDRLLFEQDEAGESWTRTRLYP